jgi:ferredoxin-NADP reductase
VVPLMSMLRHRAAAGSNVPTRLLYSVRTPVDVIYGAELDELVRASPDLKVCLTYTRAKPQGWGGYARRIDQAMLEEVMAPLGSMPRAYICGPTLLVESVATLILQSGLQRDLIRTERFGPSGGPA